MAERSFIPKRKKTSLNNLDCNNDNNNKDGNDKRKQKKTKDNKNTETICSFRERSSNELKTGKKLKFHKILEEIKKRLDELD